MDGGGREARIWLASLLPSYPSHYAHAETYKQPQVLMLTAFSYLSQVQFQTIELVSHSQKSVRMINQYDWNLIIES
jgi:hypothetical protein